MVAEALGDTLVDMKGEELVGKLVEMLGDFEGATPSYKLGEVESEASIDTLTDTLEAVDNSNQKGDVGA